MQELAFEIPKSLTSRTRLHFVSRMPFVSAVVGISFRLAFLGLLQLITLATSPGTKAVYRTFVFCDPVFKLLAELEDLKSHIWPRLHKSRRCRKGAIR
jgi:hypothetical protein